MKASFHEAVRCCLGAIHSEVNSLKEVGEMPFFFFSLFSREVLKSAVAERIYFEFTLKKYHKGKSVFKIKAS